MEGQPTQPTDLNQYRLERGPYRLLTDAELDAKITQNIDEGERLWTEAQAKMDVVADLVLEKERREARREGRPAMTLGGPDDAA